MEQPGVRQGLRVGVLGPLRLVVDDSVVDVPGERRRALLALLALADGRAVGTDRLVDALWPDDPPGDAIQALYNHVSRLRRHLGPRADRLRRQGAGYVLHLEQDELDAGAARRLAREASAQAEDPTRVVSLARQALELWRGPALEEFAGVAPLAVDAVALAELRLRLHDDLVEARIQSGDRSVTADAAQSATEHPLRERSALLHMRALAAEGRSADAMAVGTAYRARLVEETGLDPGPDLARLEQDIAAGRLGQAGPGADPAARAGRASTLAAVGRRTVVAPSGPMVGRQHDREEILRLLDSHPVLTLTGPGGVGKTRLALDIAAEASDGGAAAVVVVNLAAVDDPARVCQAVASSLGVRTAAEVTAHDVATAIGENDLLLLLDNCEHVVAACHELVTTVRSSAPGVRVLATSRASLHVPGEYVVRLQPLPVPRATPDVSAPDSPAPDLHALQRQPSVRAFVEHARRRRQGFALTPADVEPLVEIVRALDGLPLAIELAAGHVTMMPVSAVRDRLGRALDLTSGRREDEDERQRTLRLTIDWSYRLLTDDEQSMLRALAVFPGGTDLPTVEKIAGEVVPASDPLEILQRLVDFSLVAVDPTLTRYRLLFTVRAFLVDRLTDRGELEAAESRFLAWALRTAREIGEGVHSLDEPAADRRLRTELDNLRAARDVARGRGDLDSCIEITLALDETTVWRDLRELWSWCLELGDDPAVVGHPREVEIVGSAAQSARLVGDFDRSLAFAERGLAIEVPADQARFRQSRCWSAIAAVAHYRGDFEAAKTAWIRAGVPGTGFCVGNVASAALAAGYSGSRAEAERLLEQGRAAESLQPCIADRAFTAYVEAELVAVEDPARAIPLYLWAMEQAQACGANFVEGVASVALASARTRTGDVGGAAEVFGHMLDYWRTTGHQTQLWTTARNAARLLAEQGRRRTAALLLIRADATPAAAAVDRDIARHSGRVFLAPSEVAPAEEIPHLEQEAIRMTTRELVDLARSDLAALAGS